jgi:selenocysteine lyase/cysteine desulfurase
MAIAALDQLLEWGVPAIEAYSRHITRHLFDPLAQHGFEADDPDGRAAHLFGLRAPDHLDGDALKAELDRRGIYVSLRGAAIRVSPNVYNTEADVTALRDALLEAARSS